MERETQQPRRVFINYVDSYASKYIAKFLTEYAVGAFSDSDGEMGAEGGAKSKHSGAGVFQVVGTVCEKCDEDRPYVLEEYFQLDRDGLLLKLMDCDVVIYNISEHCDQVEEASWAVTALHKEMEHFSGPKMFILVSTLMTWAYTKPLEPEDLELSYTEEIFWIRKAHPNFKQHIDLEKRVAKKGKTNRTRFSTYVVASGLQYGMGEQIFHYFFKMTLPSSACCTPDSSPLHDLSEVERFVQWCDDNYLVPNVKKTKEMGSDSRAVSDNRPMVTSVSILTTVSAAGHMLETSALNPSSTSWLGQEIPIFGDGNNIVPTIHINDLASVIQNVIEHQPEPRYLIAVDNSNNTMEDIVKAVASALGPGKIQKMPFEEAFLIRDLNVLEIDSMLVNLRMNSVYLNSLFSINWLCESGMVENMELVVEEYRQTRGLLPICLCVLGPPAVGKSTVSQEICKHYKLHHIKLKDTISEAITELENVVRNVDPDTEKKYSVAEAQELLNTLKNDMEQNGGLLNDETLVKVVKDKLMSNPCRNQGFVLDGFPKTYHQAKELFPEFVFCLDAPNDFLEDRVMNLPEILVQQQNYEQEHFSQRLAKYRVNNTEDQTVVGYFSELDISPLYLEVTRHDKPDCLLLMPKIFDMVGKPRNYGLSSHEVEEVQRRNAEEKMRREAQERAEEEQQEAEEAKHSAEHWDEWTKALEEMNKQEEKLLEAESAQMRKYLMEHVMPVVTQGLIECCTLHPEDPVDFLAEYIFKNTTIDY